MQPIISVKNVTKKFKEVTAVDDVSFDVSAGEIFAFLGPNGAGKSTTIKMLTTLLKPTGGSLFLSGHDVNKEQDEARKVFGIVFQDPSLDDELTAFENMQLHAVLYGLDRKTMNQRTEELLQLVELWDRRNSIVKTFSGGMKRRLEIARGLLHHPRILFLDEPTLGLDAQTRNLLWNYVQKLNEKEGMTIFFTTHYLEEAEAIANRIAIIDHGKLVAMGDAEHLKNQTSTDSLEEAYLELTGKTVRDETLDTAAGRKEMIRKVIANRRR
ncbi:MAG TPA: ATP-binding cassette domain-containing protein [Chitinophagaceae bacterium]|jgi:ABC-2 type transport system ATP-binding protein|nr:ATP-binding cassette domain-containing protein [Chitinophagaceae bacterium]